MKRSLLGTGILALLAVTPAARAQPASDPTVSGPQTAAQLYRHVMRGVVAIERNGLPQAIGTVLSGDGRILTALSGLGGGQGADVLYADGTVVHARVGRSDRASDLALLVPESLKWSEGLRASDGDPAGEGLRVMLPAIGGSGQAAKSARLSPVVAHVKAQVDAHARDGAALVRWLEIEMKGVPVAGAPILDSAGDVAGVLVRACKGPGAETLSSEDAPGALAPSPPSNGLARAACQTVVLGAPVSAIRSFLSGAPASSEAPAAARGPWLGIRGERELSGNVHGVRVVAVAPSSPAEKAALRPSADVIVAVDGHPIDTPEKLADVIAKHAPGDTVKLLVFSADQFRDVSVALRAGLAPAAAVGGAPALVPLP